MNFKDKSRKQKLAEVILPFFNRLNSQSDGDGQAMLVSQHLLSLNEKAIDDARIKPFLKIWSSSYPEEKALTNGELLRELTSVCNVLSVGEEKDRGAVDEANRQKVQLRVIQGGLSKNPDIPYVDMEQVVHEVEF